MWILFLIIASGSGVSISSQEILTYERCVDALKFSKTRKYVADAWCVKK